MTDVSCSMLCQGACIPLFLASFLIDTSNGALQCMGHLYTVTNFSVIEVTRSVDIYVCIVCLYHLVPFPFTSLEGSFHV